MQEDIWIKKGFRRRAGAITRACKALGFAGGCLPISDAMTNEKCKGDRSS